MIVVLFWAFVVRSAQALVEAAPTLLCGLVVAAVLRRMAGPEGTRRLFGSSGVWGLLRAWALGMLLPVCALGVLPVVRELRRAGVSGGNILAFALVGPLLNPISFLYGLTLGEPKIILCYAAGSLALSLAAGLIWEWLFPSAAAPDAEEVKAAEAEPLPAPGLRRMLAVGVSTAREILGPCLGYYLVAALVSGLVSAALPFGSLQATMRRDDPLSPALMALIGAPVYMGPLPGMMRIGLMFEHGNSVGAGFVLLVMGVGVNTGVALWAIAAFGWRPALAWFGLVAALTLGLAYAAERPLATAIATADHTHAFDDFTNPFLASVGASGAEAWQKLTQKVETLEYGSLMILAALAAFALAERLLRLRDAVEGWLTARPLGGEGAAPKYDVVIPGPVLAAAALLGLAGFGALSTYIYYPPVVDVKRSLAAVRADATYAVRHGSGEEAIRRLEQWDLLTRKLQVGAFLRTGRTDPEAAKAGEELREALEKVRDHLLAGEREEAKAALSAVEAEHQKLRSAYPG